MGAKTPTITSRHAKNAGKIRAIRWTRKVPREFDQRLAVMR